MIKMLPAGYMAKRIVARPAWLKAGQVIDIYSVSSCISNDFSDYINYWKHNGFWLFDSPRIIQRLAAEHALDLSDAHLFFYEVYECEFDEEAQTWRRFDPEPAFTTQVVEPNERHLEGYDVVTFHAHTSPECSPLSCNALAAELETNRHCLLNRFEQAKQLVELGQFRDAEPGPYRIMAVWSVPWP